MKTMNESILPIPSAILLCYFDIASNRLKTLSKDFSGESGVSSEAIGSLPTFSNGQILEWHRNRIFQAQLSSLDDALTKYENDRHAVSSINRENIQAILREIGIGDFSHIVFDGRESCNDGREKDLDKVLSTPLTSSSTGLRQRPRKASPNFDNDRDLSTVSEGARNIEEQPQQQQQQQILVDAMENTNEAARLAFARSVLFLELSMDQKLPSTLNFQQFSCGNERKLKGGMNEFEELDKSSVLEYCGLVMTLVRLPEIQSYLQDGTDILHSCRNPRNNNPNNSTPGKISKGNVEDRLKYLQQLCWRAVGWDSSFAGEQLKGFLSKESKESSNFHWLKNDEQVADTLTKYFSTMAVAATNATLGTIGNENGDGVLQSDDGTTRIINVSYSEKIVSLPQSIDETSSIQSLSAPTSNAIHEHTTVQQRQQLDLAQKTSMLQQQIWDEFLCLAPHEQTQMLAKAKNVQDDFFEAVRNTPPGPERVLLMQGMDGEKQKLLVIYKLWCNQNRS